MNMADCNHYVNDLIKDTVFCAEKLKNKKIGSPYIRYISICKKCYDARFVDGSICKNREEEDLWINYSMQ